MSTSSVPLFRGKRSVWGLPVALHSAFCNQQTKWEIVQAQNNSQKNRKKAQCFCRTTHHFHVGLIVEGLSEDRHNKDVDEKWDEESDRWLNKVVLIGFFHFLLVFAIYISRLAQEEKNQKINKKKQTKQGFISNFKWIILDVFPLHVTTKCFVL